MATQRRWSDPSKRTRELIIVTAVAESIPRQRLSSTSSVGQRIRSGAEVTVGSSGSGGQFRRGRADLILRLRLAAPSVATPADLQTVGEPDREGSCASSGGRSLATTLRATTPRAISGPLAPVSQGL